MGGDDNAAEQAQRNEDQRKAQIAAATGSINSIFDNPDRVGQYDQLAKDTRGFFLSDLDKQKSVADRRLKFALARSGQVGGSVQADQGRLSGEDYLKGVLEATRRGQAAGANLRAQDETARANLTSMAQGGLDTTTAASNAASAMRSNLESSKATSTANGLGDMFGNFADLYQRSQDAKALRDGQLYAYNTLYQPGFGYGGGKP